MSYIQTVTLCNTRATVLIMLYPVQVSNVPPPPQFLPCFLQTGRSQEMAQPGPRDDQQAEPAAVRAGGRDPHAQENQRLSGCRETQGQADHRPPAGGAREAEDCEWACSGVGVELCWETGGGGSLSCYW